LAILRVVGAEPQGGHCLPVLSLVRAVRPANSVTRY
jgi:hypothetical protein